MVLSSLFFKESNKSRFDSYSVRKCIDRIPYYLSGLSRALFSDNLSRNICIYPILVYIAMVSSLTDQFVLPGNIEECLAFVISAIGLVVLAAVLGVDKCFLQ